MKRNWDVIREILLRLEQKPADEHTLQLSSFPEDRKAEFSYHAELLLEAGLVEERMFKVVDPGPYDFMLNRLRWNGHEFLNATRNDTIWNKTKEFFVSKGVSMTFDLVKSVAVNISLAYLKGQI
jgi:hypothetical protein